MENLELYRSLAAHFNEGAVAIRTPVTDSLLKILMLLFNPDEAEVALKLPLGMVSLEEAKTLYPEHGDGIEAILDDMAKRGTVFRESQPGSGKHYRLLPVLVGWAETPFWHGKETEQAKALSPVWKDYYNEAFYEEMARGVPVMRVVPIGESLKEESEILPFDEIRPLVERTSFKAVGHCPCRLSAKYRGEGCSYSTENCLHFDDMGRYMVEFGLAREIDTEETMRIIKAADDEGLVHIINNMVGHMNTICNCCGCCCSFLIPINENLGLDSLAYSNYLASVEIDNCTLCGTCEDRCPVGAIKVGDDAAEMDVKSCLGCGACIAGCEDEAVQLIKRDEVKPPPSPEEFITARMQ
ncbi:MAG: 4Fe-4S dicluster domain-containing protein [Proteobacteria bacterium]|nr:4Fe-4S dicluster domain-containing protein [Pseudomonadota bacterium]